ncbi:MAG: hypothetical protein JO146_08760 [Candidatus Eremiobacteraeota bacterium]|nr:hypothetical protein [Candidatus Eremiobacteraeota bacterium]
MGKGVDPQQSHQNLNATIERAVAQDTDPLTLLETEDALASIPNGELMLGADLERSTPRRRHLN